VFLLPFHVVGCAHDSTRADVVGQLRPDPLRQRALLRELAADGIDAVLLATCHRTELYWWGDHDLEPWFEAQIVGAHRHEVTVARSDADLAVRHLFGVAAGMHSVRFGEPEILGQVRQAWLMARDAGAVRGELDSVFRHAVDAARHIRAAIGDEVDGSLGERVVARLASFIAREATPDAGPLPVVIVGSGDAARGVLDALARAELPLQIGITNRTVSRAETVAVAHGAEVIAWEKREQAMAEARVVVFAIHASTPLLRGEALATLSASGPNRVWVDLGVPGAVDPSVSATPGTRDAWAQGGLEFVTLDELSQDVGPERRAQRSRKATWALQLELARFARASHRHSLGARLGALEEQAVAVATSQSGASRDEVARRVTRLVLRELTRQ
jgi:glutamyl-tRNA reductase